MNIEINRIVPNPDQPRQAFDDASLEELAQSIREMGVIQPITVELSEGGAQYILHTGERRWRAAQIAGLETIPAVIVDPATPEERLSRALVENVQRQDMSPLEVAKAYARMHDELGMSDQAIADKVGKSRSSIANARRLLDLPQEAQSLADAGVSERALMALLPMYRLPDRILKIGEDDDGHGGYPWNSPRALLKEIREDGSATTSEAVRRRVGQIISAHTLSLNRAAWPLDHVFDAESPSCDKCPARVKNGQEWCCPDDACFEAKENRWKAAALQAASEASGIPILQARSNYSTTERFYSDAALVEQIIAAGCENLRLDYNPYASTPHVPGHPNAGILCHHGKGNHCTCLSKLRAERTKNDPAQIAEQQRKNELQKLIAEYSQIMAAAIADDHIGAWLQVLRSVAYNQSIKGEEWDLDRIRAKIAHHLVNNRVGWQAKQDIEYARRDFGEFFGKLGLTLPGRDDPTDDIKRRFDRIRGWIDANVHQITGGDEKPTLEAVQGNLDNLLNLVDEFDAIADQHIDDNRFDGFLVDLAEAVETLNTLHQEMQAQRRFPISVVGAQTPQEAPHV